MCRQPAVTGTALRHSHWCAQFPLRYTFAMSSSSGHCGVTEVGGDCARDSRGSWDAKRHGITDIALCARHCKSRCARCNFVSWHAARGDCSWYASCPRRSYAFGGSEYETVQVRPAPSAPPPPPPAHAAPLASAPGYCSLMSASLGFCEVSDQGSWAGVRSPAECVERCASCRRCRFVSFTLANATESSVHDQSGERHGHPPSWWRCRWFRHCDLADLRSTPAGAQPWQHYVTVSAAASNDLTGVRRRRRPSFTSAPPPPPPPSPPITLAIATLLEATAGARRPGVAALDESVTSAESARIPIEGAMVQWCQNVGRLARALPSHFQVEALLMSAMVGIERRLATSAGCRGLTRALVSPELRELATACVMKLQ